ncbi:hypothetical protein CDIK_3066 [Cucumispora dikerogammari]|nr:hypothetical protein CDIK_3066 [Cucumispora dikerogammari]
MFRYFRFNENISQFIHCFYNSNSSSKKQKRLYSWDDVSLVKASCLIKDAANLAFCKNDWTDVHKIEGGLSGLKKLKFENSFPGIEYKFTKRPEVPFLVLPIFKIKSYDERGTTSLQHNYKFSQIYKIQYLTKKPTFAFNLLEEPDSIKSIKLDGTEIYSNESGFCNGGSGFLIFETHEQEDVLCIGAFIGGTDDRSKEKLEVFFNNFLLNDKKCVGNQETKIEIHLDIRRLLLGMEVTKSMSNFDSFSTLYFPGLDVSNTDYTLSVELVERLIQNEVFFEVKRRFRGRVLKWNDDVVEARGGKTPD